MPPNPIPGENMDLSSIFVLLNIKTNIDHLPIKLESYHYRKTKKNKLSLSVELQQVRSERIIHSFGEYPMNFLVLDM